MIDRRTVVTSGLLLAVGLAGCHSSSDTPRVVRSATAATSPYRRIGASRESLLADLATRAAAASTGAERKTLTALAACHRRHRDLLVQSDPFLGRVASASPSITPTSIPVGSGNAITLLTRQEAVAAAEHLKACSASENPSETLLWASLSAFCGSFDPSEPAPGPVGAVFPVTIGTEPLTDAQQVLLTHLNALVAGLEWGIGRLPSSDPMRAWGMSRRTAVLRQRADLRAAIRQASATPTPDLPGYPMPATPSTSASARSLWSRLESNVLAARGRVTAATPKSGRANAIAAMTAQIKVLTHLGTQTPTWPGWV